MILQLNQTVSGTSAAYQLVCANSVISGASVSNNMVFGAPVCFSSFLQPVQYTMSYRPLDSAKNIARQKEDRTYVPFSIDDNCGNNVGYISGKHRKRGLFNSYDYTSLTFEGVEYCCYSVGMGKEGIKYLIFKDDIQIALIEKPTVVYNNLDQYMIFATSNYYGMVAYIFGLYIDNMFFAHRGEMVQKGETKYYDKTTIKELVAMYDPGFRDYVINTIG